MQTKDKAKLMFFLILYLLNTSLTIKNNDNKKTADKS
jgi:hypothetical protein